MKRALIYLAMADTAYEGTEAMRAYAVKAEAKAFCARCNEYQSTRIDIPSPPPIEDTPENDAAHKKWFRKIERWESRHPAGRRHASCDHFHVKEMALFSAIVRGTEP